MKFINGLILNYRHMIIEVKIPSPGESVTEVEIGRWLVENGSTVRKNQEIAEVESDKATLTVVAEVGGRISVLAGEGQVVPVGSVICTIDTVYAQEITEGEPIRVSPDTSDAEENPPETASQVRQAFTSPGDLAEMKLSEAETVKAGVRTTATAREIMKDHQLTVDDVLNGLKRIGRKEVEAVVRLNQISGSSSEEISQSATREVLREKMTALRRKLSEKLVSVKNETAMLTTFNEVDMSAVMDLRQQYQQKFNEKYGFKLGFMAFFTKAVALAARMHPSVNSMLDGEELIFPQYVDVGIAVQTPKGLMVPVVRNAETKSLPEIEEEIKELAEKARNKKISIEELSGGTISITNGGVFGSLLSTPILNPPQSAILGMHNIVDRPVAINGKVEIRPMMYIALSYDHRVIDGKDSVGFLVKVKEMIENPLKMVLQGKDPYALLLDL